MSRIYNYMPGGFKMLINSLKEINKDHMNSVIELNVLLSDIKVKVGKNGKRYGDITIQDKSKTVEVKLWDYDQYESLIENIGVNNIFNVRCVVGEYQGQIQLTIKELKPNQREDISIKDFIPVSTWNYDSMINGLRGFYEKIHSPHLRELLDRMIFSEDYLNKYVTYPAAKKIHHNFYHGLLHHTLEILTYAQMVAKLKKLSQIQTDRLIVMGMLHDWAKIIEYRPLPELGFTDKGIMLGHIFLGAHHTLNVMEEIEDFVYEDKLVILNGILGHHGNLEWGSPVLPKSIEAEILHHCDKMSGDVESILSFMSEQTDEELFTTKLWHKGTEYYRK